MLEEVDRWLGELGWRVRRGAVAAGACPRALVALRRIGRDVGPEVFAPYATWAEEMASFEVSRTSAQGSRAETVAFAVAGTVVFGAAFEGLRRLAQEHRSALDAGGRRGDRLARRRPVRAIVPAWRRRAACRPTTGSSPSPGSSRSW